MVKRASKVIKFISLEEFQKILKAEDDKSTKLAYVLAFGSGLRISEIVGPAKNSNQEIKPLMPENINIQTKQIKVFGKGKKERITVINPLFPLNERMLSLLPLKINRRTLQARFTTICLKVLGRKLNFHVLRHGFANHMINDRKLPLPYVQAFLGHSRLSTTGIYSIANPVTAVDAVWEGF